MQPLDLTFGIAFLTIIITHYLDSLIPGFCRDAAKLKMSNVCIALVDLCYVALAPPPRHKHPQCFHYIVSLTICCRRSLTR